MGSDIYVSHATRHLRLKNTDFGLDTKKGIAYWGSDKDCSLTYTLSWS